MEYQIPKGFEEFVSDAETLLGQFDSFPSSSTASDIVIYSVYTLQHKNDSCDHVPPIKNLKYLYRLCKEINAYASSICQNYIWCKDGFRLYVTKVQKDGLTFTIQMILL